MRRFLVRVALFGLLILVLDLPFRWAMDRLPDTEYDGRLRRIMKDSLDADILVFGSSRAARNVLPERIAAITGHTAFGLGYPGANIEWQEFVLRQVLSGKHSPRLVLLVVDDPAELIRMPKVNFRLDRAYPLVAYATVNDEVCERTGRSALFSRILASYRIKESVDNLWDPPQPDRFDTVYTDGSMTTAWSQPEMDTAHYQNKQRIYSADRESDTLRAVFQRFASNCAQHHVQLMIVHPPDLRPPCEAFVARMHELAGPQALVYRYDTTETRYREARYYFDRLHLNREGARIFSDELATHLRDTVFQTVKPVP
jgi:hypothetical protein